MAGLKRKEDAGLTLSTEELIVLYTASIKYAFKANDKDVNEVNDDRSGSMDAVPIPRDEQQTVSPMKRETTVYVDENIFTTTVAKAPLSSAQKMME